MIVADSIAAVQAGRTPAGWTRPQTGSWCFDAVPGTVERLLLGHTARPALPAAALGALGERTWERVVLVYLDAFGWERLARHDDHPFVRRVEQEGRASLITSQFPSTTSVHVTTVHTGLPLREHGVLEWFCYEPRLDRVIAPLLFAIPGTPERDALVEAGLTARDVFGETSLYAALAERGVRSEVHQSAAFTPSRPSDALLTGASAHGFATPEQGLERLAAGLDRPGPAYAFAYLESADAAMHRHGAWSAEATAEVVRLLDALEERLVGGAAGEALLLVVSDHGMSDLDPAASIPLDERWPGIVDHLRRGSDGEVLAPAGSCRDLFLHVLPGRADDVVAGVQEVLGEVATVHRVDRLVRDGWFGGAPGPRLAARLGDVLVVPQPGESVWWSGHGRFRMDLRANHGGPWPGEMEVPFLALPIGA